MQHRILDMRASDGSIVKFECHDVLPSTSQLAKEYAKLGYPDRYVVFSEGRIKSESDHLHRRDVEKGLFMSCIFLLFQRFHSQQRLRRTHQSK